ncbi:UNVERIFIED_CONTAM: hypothetical protein FKN15_031041 [Acipenser sinensis]
MDKLMVDNRGKATISNDGATILKLLDVVHPAAKTLVGDGTTSVTLLAAEFLKQVKPYVEEGLHPQTIIRAFRTATQLAVKKINEIAVSVKKGDKEKRLETCVLRLFDEDRKGKTAMSDLVNIGPQRRSYVGPGPTFQFSLSGPMSDPVRHHQKDIKHRSLFVFSPEKAERTIQWPMFLSCLFCNQDSQLVAGVAFKKTFSYAGFEMQPKKYENPKIALLNVELELKAEKENAEVRVKSVEDYQAIVDAEWNILYDKLEKIYKSGAKVVLSKLPIGDVATQFFADRDLFCAGRVQEEDLKRTMMACGGSIQTSVGSLTDDVLGQCALFEEVQVGGERYNFFKGCPKAKTCTIILRGGAEQFMEETERSLHDAIMIVRRAIKAGMWYGVDVNNEDIADNYIACVWEPSIVRINALTAASEAACLILSVDETIKNPRSTMDGPPGGQGRGRGRPHAH